MPLSGPPPTNCPVARRRCHIAAYSTSGFAGSITHFVGAGVRAHRRIAFHVLPPSVVLYMPAIAAGRPQRPLRGDVHDVRVARIDLDVADVLGVGEADARPGRAARRWTCRCRRRYIELRGFEFSPVPSQTMFEFFGSTLTQQRLNEPPRSKIGVESSPRFVALPQRRRPRLRRSRRSGSSDRCRSRRRGRS